MSKIITKEDVVKIAELAKLKLTEEEVGKYEKNLSEFFEHAKALEEIDTEGVEPLYQVLGLQNVMRKDEIIESEISKDLISCSQNKSENGSFLVKNVL